jgi:hypothetical protein
MTAVINRRKNKESRRQREDFKFVLDYAFFKVVNL